MNKQVYRILEIINIRANPNTNILKSSVLFHLKANVSHLNNVHLQCNLKQKNTNLKLIFSIKSLKSFI